MGKDGVCCHRRASVGTSVIRPSGDDPHQNGSCSDSRDPPGLGEMNLEKGAFHQKSWLGFTSTRCLWSLPPAAFPRSATKCFTRLETLFFQPNKKKK